MVPVIDVPAILYVFLGVLRLTVHCSRCDSCGQYVEPVFGCWRDSHSVFRSARPFSLPPVVRAAEVITSRGSSGCSVVKVPQKVA